MAQSFSFKSPNTNIWFRISYYISQFAEFLEFWCMLYYCRLIMDNGKKRQKNYNC